MTARDLASRNARGVLFAHNPAGKDSGWFGDVVAVFDHTGLAVFQAHSGPDAIRCVERGGLAGAVLIGDRGAIDGLALLRIIRSIDAELPCWLVTNEPTRPTLEVALSLRATCVMNQPASGAELALAVRRLLMN